VIKGEGERSVDSNDGHSKELLRSLPTILHISHLACTPNTACFSSYPYLRVLLGLKKKKNDLL
jgi:hypothetical protein